ncbi:MAG: hypothetical protein H6739_23335 [Alphaproteobacteria bacterium]|nr:hypothetical protein [Alphaproteobacteria bacterium]
MDLPDLEQLTQLTHAVPRGVAVALGGLLAVAGARLYPVAIMAPGFAAGIGAAVLLPVEMPPEARAVLAVVLGGIGALICRTVERMAIWGLGAIITGGATVAAWPVVMGQPAPWWGAAVGAAAGLLLFPALFKVALKPVTALAGAFIVANALDQGQNLWLIGGVAVVGLLVQLGVGGSKDDDEDE